MKIKKKRVGSENAVVRQIVFSKALFDLMDVRLRQLGITAPEYVRQLVIEDVKPLYQNIPMIDIDTERSLGIALDDIMTGKITKFDSTEDLKSHLDTLVK